jgi:hypothetical protein
MIMRRALTAAVLFGALGCAPETVLSQTEGELEVSPTLLDLGTVAVGETIEFPFQVDHLRGGIIDLRNVTVSNIEGEYFDYLGTEGAVQLDRAQSLDLGFVYAPQDEGYHRATVEITHTGRDSPTQVEVRARATVPEVIVAPLGLDFGPVDLDEVASRSVTVTNNSGLDLLITDAQVSNNVFTLTESAPFTIAGGSEKVFSVDFAPTGEEAATGTLTFRLGDVALPKVTLRGNDCENGAPAEYDVDSDGYTICGGDCDDGNADIRPGVPETWDLVDEDCDSEIDEGTAGYDDDGDGYCEGPGECSDGSIPGDCHDGAANVNPGAREDIDNGIDDDCDGVVDLGTTDTDFDGYSPEGGDCDDTDPDTYPGAPELPDAIDNDCDGDRDEGTIWYDDDGDGYCEGPSCTDGAVPGDCDDDTGDLSPVDGLADGFVTNPGAGELPDWRDNNCNGIVDETTVNYDDDGDGFTENGGDCDDDDPLVSPAYGNC